MRLKVLSALAITGLMAITLVLSAPARAATTPQAAVDELLAADRAYSAASARTDLISGLSAMFDAELVMPSPSGLVYGPEKARATLAANPDNATSRAEWTPLRGGISADGQHGFTMGLMNIQRQGKDPLRAAYLAYWVKRPQGWRVLTYTRKPSNLKGDLPPMFAPSLPARMVAPVNDPARLERDKASLIAAEKLFSDEAQVIGIGPAFRKHGHAESINLAPDGFLIGADRIAGPSEAKTSPVNWSSDGVAVASSGDLGVSWGSIRSNTAGDGRPAANPFFTIWRRDAPDQPWRYIAE